MDIKVDDLHGVEIIQLLQEHLNDMYATSPAESVHALDLDGLRQPAITFWTGWVDGQLAGCGAVKELNPQQAEIKSMRTSAAFRRQGIAAQMLEHILQQCTQRGYQQVSLETGSMEYFAVARQLYERFGFEYCAPFGDYQLDPNSAFMSKRI